MSRAETSLSFQTPGSRSRVSVETLIKANPANRSFCLRNGVVMPLVGLGTFLARGNEVRTAVRVALECGIRHLDTAAVYRNEADVAAALAASGVPREEVFLTSKLAPQSHGHGRAEVACRRMLATLGTDYVDLVLIHWPGCAKLDPGSAQNAVMRQETWEVLEDYYRRGVFRAIGVSNYDERHLTPMLGGEEGATSAAPQAPHRVRPFVNQVEVHPKWQGRAVRRFGEQHGIFTVAYSSLGCGHLLKDPVVGRVAEREGVSAAKLLLRWGLQKGCAVLPKSVNPDRIRDFAPDSLMPPVSIGEQGVDDIFPQGLISKEAERQLDELEDGTKYCWDPAAVA